MAAMNVGQTTKAFSQAPQENLGRHEKVNQAELAEFKKAFGDQEVGDVLNKLSDPNWVDPAKMRKVGNPKLDKDAFLKLMLTQMQNQDPTNPLKSHEMAAQLAQFTSLEQLSNMNQTLESMAKNQNADSPMESLNLIGKMVQGDAAKFTRQAGEKNHDFLFKLPQDASKVKIEVKNQEGKVLKSFDLAALKAGENKISWNGVGDDGLEGRAGEYRFEIKAESSPGKSINVDTSFDGQITGVKFVGNLPVLMVGNKTVKMTDVQQIRLPDGPTNSQVQDVTPMDQLKQATGKEQEPQMGNLADLNLPPELMNQVSKEMEGGNGKAQP